jgi:ribosome maturation factor RimP
LRARFFLYLETLLGVAERVSELIEPIAASLGYELVRVRYKGHVLQIMAEKPDGTMRIEDCTILSKAISPVLDETDPISENYSLEVSSPGIDRPLTREKDFVKWSGHEAKIELERPLNRQKRFRGIVRGYNDDAGSVHVELADTHETVALPFADISDAKLILTDELLKHAAKANPIDETEFDEVEVEDERVANSE